MIPIAEINKKATQYRVPAETIEKDYMISWVLHCLSTTQISQQFVFRGGTAIKRMYFEDHRFSEDIDFLGHESFNTQKILDQLSSLSQAKDEANIIFSIDDNRIEATSGRLIFYIHYSGFDEIIGPPKEIKVDFCLDHHKFESIENRQLISSYTDTESHKYPIQVMSLNSIIANKLGMLNDSTRNEPRDLYDVWFLLKRIKYYDFNLDEIKKRYKDKYNFIPTLNSIEHSINNPSLSKTWNNRLQLQISNLPSIETVIKEMINLLKQYHY
jgi:predicted nucleotidyltransferase component of viral defense system